MAWWTGWAQALSAAGHDDGQVGGDVDVTGELCTLCDSFLIAGSQMRSQLLALGAAQAGGCCGAQRRSGTGSRQSTSNTPQRHFLGPGVCGL